MEARGSYQLLQLLGTRTEADCPAYMTTGGNLAACVAADISPMWLSSVWVHRTMSSS